VHLALWRDPAPATDEKQATREQASASCPRRGGCRCRLVAVKTLSKRAVVERGLAAKVENERRALFVLLPPCPFIVGALGAYQSAHFLHLVLEWCPGGNLGELVRRRQGLSDGGSDDAAGQRRFGLPEGAARFYLAEVFLALEHVHEHGLIFRDLKPDNVVLNRAGHALLVDFGLVHLGRHHRGGAGSGHAKCHQRLAAAPELVGASVGGCGYGGSSDGAVECDALLTGDGCVGPVRAFTLCGSDEYVAPECVLRVPGGYDFGVDHWALGCVAFELLLGRSPFAAPSRAERFLNITTPESWLGRCGGGPAPPPRPGREQLRHSDNHANYLDGIAASLCPLRPPPPPPPRGPRQLASGGGSAARESSVRAAPTCACRVADLSPSARALLRALLAVDPAARLGGAGGWDAAGARRRAERAAERTVERAEALAAGHPTAAGASARAAVVAVQAAQASEDLAKEAAAAAAAEVERGAAGRREVRAHAFFAGVGWAELAGPRRPPPPFAPFPRYHPSHVAHHAARQPATGVGEPSPSADAKGVYSPVGVGIGAGVAEGDGAVPAATSDTRNFAQRFTGQAPGPPAKGHPHKGGPTPPFEGFLPMPPESFCT